MDAFPIGLSGQFQDGVLNLSNVATVPPLRRQVRREVPHMFRQRLLQAGPDGLRGNQTELHLFAVPDNRRQLLLRDLFIAHTERDIVNSRFTAEPVFATVKTPDDSFSAAHPFGFIG
ncbi:MAG: hypothetical protein ABSG78_14570 [Verrucomicrobiota bacterium]